MGTKPNAPTKNTDAMKTQKHMATFSLQACFASASSFLMHELGMRQVTHLLKLYHHMARLFLSAPVTFACLAFLFVVLDARVLSSPPSSSSSLL